MKPIFRISLRLKLTLVSLLLLLIPLIGFRFSNIIKQDLVESRKKTLLFSARAVSSTLGSRVGLFDQELFHALNASRDLYIYQLSSPMRLNGKVDDWQPQLKEAGKFAKEHLLLSTSAYNFASLHFKHLIGMRGNYLYALFIVTDDRVVYRNPKSLRLDLSDHLQIGIENKDGEMHRYLLTTDKPGWVNGFLMPDDKSVAMPKRPEPKIQGMWVETDEGYIIELRIAKDIIGQKLAFAIADVDDERRREVTTIIGTATTESGDKLGWLLSPSTVIENLLKSLDRPHSRVLVVDSNRRVRASYGSLANANEPGRQQNGITEIIRSWTYTIFSPLYQLFTEPFTDEFAPTIPQPETLTINGISEALKGKSSVTSYFPVKEQVEIMAAIVPLMDGREVVGAVVVEQTTNSILALQNKVIEESLTFTILAFIIGGFGLLLFASRLSSRIRSLRNQALAAITDSGQVVASIQSLSSGDEIGDLSRTLNSMLNQLKAQIEYREKMADNLEHEIRTPLAGISASLKNMAHELENPPQRIGEYLDWALEDVDRLEALLTAIRDATNLQEALTRDFKEDFDLARALEVWLQHSWQQAFAGVDFSYLKPSSPVMLYGDPARIRQLLDKLIENAVCFHKEQSPVEIELMRENGSVVIKVSNQGISVPEEMEAQIFNSMFSFRQQKKDSKPHLGLGLYIVRTIVEHHLGTVSVNSLDNGLEGAVFSIRLPANQ